MLYIDTYSFHMHAHKYIKKKWLVIRTMFKIQVNKFLKFLSEEAADNHEFMTRQWHETQYGYNQTKYKKSMTIKKY